MKSTNNQFNMNITLRYLIVIACFCFLPSCASVQPTNFYTLSKPLASVTNQKQATSTLKEARLTQVSVTVPDGLKRPQIVINAKDGSRVIVLEHNRWLTAFDEELQDALSNGINANLTPQLQSDGEHYRVAITLLQMDTFIGETVSSKFHWKILPSQNLTTNNNLTCEFSASKTIGNDVASAVIGMQEIIQDVVTAIAQQIESMASAPMITCNG